MAKRKKRIKPKKISRSPDIPTRSTQIKLETIARKLGTSVSFLLESYGDPEIIIEKFDSGDLMLLVENE